jgi:hypothetical protein
MGAELSAVAAEQSVQNGDAKASDQKIRAGEAGVVSVATTGSF